MKKRIAWGVVILLVLAFAVTLIPGTPFPLQDLIAPKHEHDGKRAVGEEPDESCAEEDPAVFRQFPERMGHWYASITQTDYL